MDLNEELAEVLSSLHPGINQKNPDSEIGELCEVYDSKTAIRHLSHNLLGNASGM